MRLTTVEYTALKILIGWAKDEHELISRAAFYDDLEIENMRNAAIKIQKDIEQLKQNRKQIGVV